ncbi:type IV pilus modification PilV family protein [Legionella spiritensis]|uniref:type IV pilus modification PilV family protein n=1 Tax=Legionella spiritensis TaxID=452 RepID=UPI0007302220|nr:hypothetical protein [Legionella spiritensis]
MNTSQGFSLVEVLVSLCLVTGTALMLLSQQWQMSRLFNDIRLSHQAVLQFDNAIERVHAGIPLPVMDAPFTLKITHSGKHVDLYLNWPDILNTGGSSHCQHQQVVVLA